MCMPGKKKNDVLFGTDISIIQTFCKFLPHYVLESLPSVGTNLFLHVSCHLNFMRNRHYTGITIRYILFEWGNVDFVFIRGFMVVSYLTELWKHYCFSNTWAGIEVFTPGSDTIQLLSRLKQLDSFHTLIHLAEVKFD